MNIPKNRFEWAREYPKTGSRTMYCYSKEMADKVANAAIENLKRLAKLTKSLNIK